MPDFDLFVIGAGSGGVRAARKAAAYGARVAIAEERYLGGTCVNVGCIPKKLYAYAAHFRHERNESAGFGWEVPEAEFHWARLRDNKKAEIVRLNGVYQNLLEQSGVALIQGRATVLGPQAVGVNGRECRAESILIATGGWPVVPNFPGRELAATSNEIFDLDDLPARILIVGGGYIALEFVGIFAGLGSETTLSYRGKLPLRAFDLDVRERILRENRRHAEFRLESRVKAIAHQGDGSLLVSFEEGGELEVDCVLSATGRAANTAGLGLENTAVRMREDGCIAVNEFFQSAEPGIYALGDVIGKAPLTPVAIAEAEILAANLFAGAAKTLDYRHIPSAVFSHPVIGVVGLTEEQARAEFAAIDIYETEFRYLKHTLSGSPERTYMKVIVNRENDVVLGIHILGPEAGEIIQGFAAAMNCGLTKQRLDQTIGVHPTVAEELVTMGAAARRAE